MNPSTGQVEVPQIILERSGVGTRVFWLHHAQSLSPAHFLPNKRVNQSFKQADKNQENWVCMDFTVCYS